MAISDENSRLIENLQEQLRSETAAREAAERETAALQVEKRQLEQRVINANRTLAYGLGKALIDARSLKGMAALPRRLRGLRLKQKAKRKQRVPDTIPTGIAEQLRLVDPALDKARVEGIESAASWVEQSDAEAAAKARALAELAILAADKDADLATRLGEQARAFGKTGSRFRMLAAVIGKEGHPIVPPSESDVALAAKEFGIECTGWKIACVATLADDAGIARLVDAFARLSEDQADSRLIVLGTGDEQARQRLAELAAERDVTEQIRFLGEPAPQRWPALFGYFDATIFPRERAEPKGSEIPAMLKIAQAQGVSILVNQALSEAAIGGIEGNLPELPADLDWAEAIRSVIL